jgi:predicted phage gp36 major capsid-like protein
VRPEGVELMTTMNEAREIADAIRANVERSGDDFRAVQRALWSRAARTTALNLCVAALLRGDEEDARDIAGEGGAS